MVLNLNSFSIDRIAQSPKKHHCSNQRHNIPTKEVIPFCRQQSIK